MVGVRISFAVERDHLAYRRLAGNPQIDVLARNCESALLAKARLSAPLNAAIEAGRSPVAV
jgi:hypothetical protein